MLPFLQDDCFLTIESRVTFGDKGLESYRVSGKIRLFLTKNRHSFPFEAICRIIISSYAQVHSHGDRIAYWSILSAGLIAKAGRTSLGIIFPWPQKGQTRGSIPVIRVRRSSQVSLGDSSASSLVKTPKSFRHRNSFLVRLRLLKRP